MRHTLLLSMTALLIAGCSSKEEKSFTHIYENNKAYHAKLQKTEKTQLYDGEVTKAMLTATYLFTPTKDQNDTRDERFIVGLYIEDDGSEEGYSDYNLTLNGTAPKAVKALSMHDPLLKNISFRSEWSRFYLFTFPHTKAKRFSLIFESDAYGKGKLHFAKVAKYVFTKEAF